jgi:hypothetical protein
METQISTGHSSTAGMTGMDTTFVLFFLAMDFGRAYDGLGPEAIVSGITLIMLVILPYFLPTMDERPDFGRWLIGRILIAGFAGLLGAAFWQGLGRTLPEYFRFMPMTLLIVSAMVSCSLQYYGMIKFRLAR